MPGVVVDGSDFFAVYEAAGEAIRRAREGKGPTLLECKTNRYYGHFEGDGMAYRAPGEVRKLRQECDPLKSFTKKVTTDGLLATVDLASIDQEVERLIDDAVAKAIAAPNPAVQDLITDVYISY
jgi:pyruvate dehydrogenase E1 component alpha subunit